MVSKVSETIVLTNKRFHMYLLPLIDLDGFSIKIIVVLHFSLNIKIFVLGSKYVHSTVKYTRSA